MRKRNWERERLPRVWYHQAGVDFLLCSPFQLVLNDNIREAHVFLLANGEQVARSSEGKGRSDDVLPSNF